MLSRSPLASLLARTLVLGSVLALVAGGLGTWLRLSELTSGHVQVFWRLAAAEVNRWLLIAVAALVLWLTLFALARRATKKERLAALVATAIVLAPGALLLGLWVNRALLPDLLTVQSLLGNAALGVGVLVLLFVAAPALRRWYVPSQGSRLALAVLLVPIGLNVPARLTKPAGPNMIVILIDVLGARRLSCYGYERKTTPNIDRFAKDAVLFENAIAQSSFTKTSVASLFTGLWPHHHGVYFGNLEDTEGNITSDVLRSEHVTLAESLRGAGYLTLAWVANNQLEDYMGFNQGFAHYDDEPGALYQMLNSLESWVDKWRGTWPFFAYLHVIDLHTPYDPRPPYDEMFGSYSGPGPFDWEESIEYKNLVCSGKLVPPPGDIQQLLALHDGELFSIDEQIGALFDGLKRAGVYDDALIVVMSDHGDAFMEHDFIEHSNTPFEEVIHVPLIVKLPGSQRAGLRIPDPVALVDLAPALEQLAGAEPILGRIADGTSLRPWLEDGSPEPREWVLSEYENRVAFRGARWKYVSKGYETGWLFDLQEDPGEEVDRLSEYPEMEAEIAQRVQGIIDARVQLKRERVELDETTIGRLRALGYIE